MNYGKDRAWFEIDLGAIRHNYAVVKNALPEQTGVIAVVKADAYGLGAVPIARTLEDAGVEIFAVATLEEAMALRDAGVRARIMLMGPMDNRHLALAIRQNIELYVVGEEYAVSVSQQAERLGKTAAGHLVLDAGLGRFGISLSDEAEARAEIARVLALPNLRIVAACAHLTASSAVGGRELDRHQAGLFLAHAQEIAAVRPEVKLHLLSSLPMLTLPEHSLDYVRVGSLLFGLAGMGGPLDLRPAVGLKTVVCQLRRLERGALVSYGPEFTTLRPTRTAIVPIGYADGLRRSLSNKGTMLIGGARAPIIGKVCCDFTILDVTDIEGVQVGDVATIFGTDGRLGQAVGDFAALYPASGPEVTASFTARIPRFYVEPKR